MYNNNLLLHPGMDIGLPAGESLFEGDDVYISEDNGHLYRATQKLKHGRIWRDYEVGQDAWFTVECECVIEFQRPITVNSV